MHVKKQIPLLFLASLSMTSPSACRRPGCFKGVRTVPRDYTTRPSLQMNNFVKKHGSVRIWKFQNPFLSPILKVSEPECQSFVKLESVRIWIWQNFLGPENARIWYKNVRISGTWKCHNPKVGFSGFDTTQFQKIWHFQFQQHSCPDLTIFLHFQGFRESHNFRFWHFLSDTFNPP